MELQDIIPCDPPPPSPARAPGPTLPVDQAILDALANGPMELREITAVVEDTTHNVFSRVDVLMRKGLVVRRPNPRAAARGPGASMYLRVG